MFTFSFEDVSSTVAATKGRNHSADEEEEEEGREEKGEEEDTRTLTSWVFICQEISLSFWVLFSLLFTQRQFETMHLIFFALDPCCSEEKFFFFFLI